MQINLDAYSFGGDCDITSGLDHLVAGFAQGSLLKYEEERWFLLTMNHVEFSANFTGLPLLTNYI